MRLLGEIWGEMTPLLMLPNLLLFLLGIRSAAAQSLPACQSSLLFPVVDWPFCTLLSVPAAAYTYTLYWRSEGNITSTSPFLSSLTKWWTGLVWESQSLVGHTHSTHTHYHTPERTHTTATHPGYAPGRFGRFAVVVFSLLLHAPTHWHAHLPSPSTTLPPSPPSQLPAPPPLSLHPAMLGADIMLLQRSPDSPSGWSIGDYWSTDFVQPQPDTSQDVTFHSVSQDSTYTRVVFSRPVRSCDPQDKDILVDTSQEVIFAFGFGALRYGGWLAV